MGKYQPLTEHLAALAAPGRECVELNFAEIAGLVGGLPASSAHRRQWWANSSTTQAQSWRDADWHVDEVNFDRQRVRYARGPVGGSYQARERRPLREAAAAVLVEETGAADLDVRVRLRWQRAGTVTRDAAGDLVFPELPRSPGIYRLTLSDGPGQELPSIYVGESDELRKRAYNYRRPAASQQTSLRIHAELQAHLRSGGVVTMAVVTEAEIDARGEVGPLPLGRKTARVFAEHAALALAYLDGDVVVINRDRGADVSDER